MRDAVVDTLRQPEVVVQSANDPLIRLYYRFYHRTMVGGKHLCLIVKMSQRDAFVVTAYLTDRVKKGIVVWPKKPLRCGLTQKRTSSR